MALKEVGKQMMPEYDEGVPSLIRIAKYFFEKHGLLTCFCRLLLKLPRHQADPKT